MGTYLSRTPGSAGNRKTMTFSCWVKRSGLSSFQSIISAGTNGATYSDDLSFQSSDKIMLDLITTSGRYQAESSALFRDPSSWYHVVIAINTTAASNRMLVYVNNEQVAVNSGGIPQNQDITFNNNTLQEIGRRGSNSSNFGSYYLTDFNFIDGQALTPSTFGETDSTTGEWKPKVTFSGLTYGTNGFRLQFGNAAALGTDTSGQSNNFTVNNAGTNAKTVDTATNNFATLDPLSNYYPQSTFSKGNNKIQTATSTYTYNLSNMGVSKGKWFMEARAGAKSGGGNWYSAGIAEGPPSSNALTLGRDTYYPSSNGAGQIGYYGYATNWVYQNDNYYLGAASNYTTSNYGDGSIIGIALDADNNNVKFYADGVVQNSGTAFTIGASSTGFWHFAFGEFDGSNNYIWETNFGNPTYTISSGNADANGHGNFEYAVPSGYYALCTKNINQYG